MRGDWERKVFARFFLYQIPFFTVSGLLLLLIYLASLPEKLEKAILILALVLLVLTPYLSFLILRKKYKLTFKR